MVFVAEVATGILGHYKCIKDFLKVSESEAVTVVTGQNQLTCHYPVASPQLDCTS